MGKNSFFSKKGNSKKEDVGVTAEQIKDIAQQVQSLKLKLKETEEENWKLEEKYLNLKHENDEIKDSSIVKNQAEKKLEEQISKLKIELNNCKKEKEKAESKIQLERKNHQKSYDDLKKDLSEKESENEKLMKEKLSIKSNIADALLELNEHFEYKVALLDSERELVSQERVRQKAQEELKNSEWEKMLQQAQEQAEIIIEDSKQQGIQILEKAREEAQELEKESKDELNRVKERIDYYSDKINEAANTIDTLLNSVSRF